MFILYSFAVIHEAPGLDAWDLVTLERGPRPFRAAEAEWPRLRPRTKQELPGLSFRVFRAEGLAGKTISADPGVSIYLWETPTRRPTRVNDKEVGRGVRPWELIVVFNTAPDSLGFRAD